MKFCAVAVLLLFAFTCSFAQDGKKPTPDGTDGQVFEADTSTSTRKYENWNQFDGKLTTLRIAGGYIVDLATYIQDDNAKKQIDSSGGEMKNYNMRDFRIQLSGRLKLNIKREITWKAAVMYDGNVDAWLMRETGVMVEMPELSGRIWVGRSKEGISMQKTMNGYSVWGFERQPGLDMVPIMADGIKYLGYWKQTRIFWTASININWLSKNQGFSTYRWQTNLRVGWLAVNNEAQQTLLQFAGYYRYGKPEDGVFKVTGKPEASTAPFFINTGTFNTDHSNTFGAEVYFTRKSFMMGSELYAHKFDVADNTNPVFKAADLMVTYLFTGESRPYTTVGNLYGFAPVKKPVFRGGPGAWEGTLRFSVFDADDGNLHGGTFWKISPIIIWHLSKNARLGFAYGYGVLDRFDLKGTTHFFQWRIHLLL